jgi:hypothetical protein
VQQLTSGLFPTTGSIVTKSITQWH